MVFQPTQLSETASGIPTLSSGSDASGWTPVLAQRCDFGIEVFETVMTNLIWNPNINSSFVFRADCVYDDGEQCRGEAELGDSDREMWSVSVDGFTATRTIIRRMIPRNPQRDASMLQTCCFFRPTMEPSSGALVVYRPHAQSEETIPFYHPKVAGIAYLHSEGNIYIFYKWFQDANRQPLEGRLLRTAHSLLGTVYKHGQGVLSGYEKRVKHDTLVLQAKLQDTYTRLKTKYAKRLIDSWIEVTDPSKHVFEDLCIAAFLMSLWAEMYSGSEFPGFVDIGAGNGLLVHILIAEGYNGWGFDARRRKSWATYPISTQESLHELILVPKLIASSDKAEIDASISHDGIFPTGTFIISNHADELTVWTPLLAFLSQSPFLCIPCCSHSLSGQRFRAPVAPKNQTGASKKSSKSTGKTPSAYASLCDYTERLGEELGLRIEREMLRIPSTRNVGLVCRTVLKDAEFESMDDRLKVVSSIVEREGGGLGWTERCLGLKSKSANH